ncbi:MAG: phage holin family protein [Actinomycetota bacterium]
MQLLLRWVISAGALYATAWILQALGFAKLDARYWHSWFVAVIIMALVNALIRPIARLITAPLNCLTFGLVGVVVNAIMFWLVAALSEAAGAPVFEVTPLGALIGSLLVGAIGGLLSKLIIRDREDDEDRSRRPSSRSN